MKLLPLKLRLLSAYKMLNLLLSDVFDQRSIKDKQGLILAEINGASEIFEKKISFIKLS